MTKEEIYKEFQTRGMAKRESLDISEAPYSREEAEAYQEGWRAAWSWAFDLLGDIVTEPEEDDPVGYLIRLSAGHIRNVLQLCRGDRKEAARMMGIEEQTLDRWIEKYGILNRSNDNGKRPRFYS